MINAAAATDRPGPDKATAVDLGPAPILHLLSPPSLKSWFPWFANLQEGDSFIEVAEDDPDAEQRFLATIATREPSGSVIIYSGHKSLSRDRRIAAALRELGYTILFHQSPRAIEAGIDKLTMKTIFAAHGIPTEPFLVPGQTVPADIPYLIKMRNGTQGDGVRRASPLEVVPQDAYAEPFVEGIEYSVVTYTRDGLTGTMPPIWKGAVRSDLQPPFQRLRTCPCAVLHRDTEQEFRNLARQIAGIVSVEGLMELELVLKPNGQVSVLEINPRVSGTMRLAAMACGVALFTEHSRMIEDLEPNTFAVEFPNLGPHFSRPDERIFATSRVTIAADSLEEIIDRLTAAPELGAGAYLAQLASLAGSAGLSSITVE